MAPLAPANSECHAHRLSTLNGTIVVIPQTCDADGVPAPRTTSPAQDTLRTRAKRLATMKIEYVPSEMHFAHDADRCLTPTVQADEGACTTIKAPADTPPYLADLYRTNLLTPQEEFDLFRRMNYLKYRAETLQKQLSPKHPSVSLIDQIESHLNEALRVRNRIVRANLRLVVSIAKTLVDESNSFDDLVSDGNVPLVRAVELFDVDRGNRFSTYATWSVRNTLYRSTQRTRRRTKRFVTGATLTFESSSDARPSTTADERSRHDRYSSIRKLLATLDKRDRTIVTNRFGLNEAARPHRYREIAAKLNISTERTRQLLIRALGKLRVTMDEGAFDLD